VKNISHLTEGYPAELAEQIRKTYPGQAHFAGTGPVACTCGQCAHHGYYRVTRNDYGDAVKTTKTPACAEFWRLTGKHGPAVPRNAEACKYFQRRDGE